MRFRASWIALCCLLAAPVLAAPPFAKGGTDILHLTVRTGFVGTGAGTLDAKLRQQGAADIQKIKLEVSGLSSGAHDLFLWHRGEAGFDVDPVLGFVTDEDGEASLKLMHIGHKNAPNKKFPPGLDPLSNVVAMQIRDGLGNPVLDADLTAPQRLGYLVKRRLTPAPSLDDAGILFMKERVKESESKVKFRLRAGNLDPNADYTLAINCTDAATLFECASEESFTTDADGRLDIEELPATAPMPFQITDLALVHAGMVVLSTELP